MMIAAGVSTGLSGSNVAGTGIVRGSRPVRVARPVMVCALLVVSAVVAAGASAAGATPATPGVVDPATVNVVENGSFETGGTLLAPWIFRHDVAGSLTVGTGDAVDGAQVAKVHVAATSPSAWLVQLRQENIRLQGANVYTLSFSAKASTSRLINARLQSPIAPYPTFIARDFTLTANWQRFAITYTAKVDTANVFVGFNLAQAVGDVEIDQVSLTTSNLVSNGGFETGGAAMSPWIWRNDIDATLSPDTTSVFDGTRSARISVPTVASRAHHVQLRQPIPAIVAGASYRVSFAIKASRVRTANVRLQSSDSPYPTVVATDFTVSTAWTRVSFDWVPTVTVPDPFLGFNLAQDTGTVWLDDITLTRRAIVTGTFVGWGYGGFGSLTPPAGLTGVTAIAAGNFHTVALKSDGTVAAWGHATAPTGLTDVTAIAAGGLHSLALKSDGTVVGWGDNGQGQATPPTGLTGVTATAAGGYHSLALKGDGTVVGWGADFAGQATPPAGLTGVIAIAAGWEHSLALKADGTVVGWGNNALGRAKPPAGLTVVIAIAAGHDHSLALKGDGTVVGWGANALGEATPPAALFGVTAIDAGWAFSVALG